MYVDLKTGTLEPLGRDGYTAQSHTTERYTSVDLSFAAAQSAPRIRVDRLALPFAREGRRAPAGAPVGSRASEDAACDLERHHECAGGEG